MTRAKKGWALVTGASGGIGLELSKVLGENGFDLLLLLVRSEDKLRHLAREIQESFGVEATIIPVDLSDAQAARAVFDNVRERGIQVDVLVNNAGLMFEGSFRTTDFDDHMRLLRVNVVALTALTRLFLEPMLQRKNGRILNVASVAAFMPIPNLAVYAASKAYGLSFSEALSEEIKGSNVTVTALCPGVTDTGMVYGTDLSKLPKLMIMDAKAVAQEGYAACMAGKAIHVAGAANDLAVQWVKYQPKWLVRAVGGVLARNSASWKS